MIEPYCPNDQAERRRAASVTDEPPLPHEATSALPGTSEKVEVLAARADAGQALWHPHDDDWEGKIAH